jgi:hypothetical protein
VLKRKEELVHRSKQEKKKIFCTKRLFTSKSNNIETFFIPNIIWQDFFIVKNI